jgi:hypothetical protein
MYTTALCHGLAVEVRVSTKESLSLPFLGRKYVPELELTPAATPHHRLEYHVIGDRRGKKSGVGGIG